MSSHKALEISEKAKQVFLFELEKAAADIHIFAGELFDLARFLEVFQPELEVLEAQFQKYDEMLKDTVAVIRSYNDFVQIACETIAYHYDEWNGRVYSEELEGFFWSLQNRSAQRRDELQRQIWELQTFKDACLYQQKPCIH